MRRLGLTGSIGAGKSAVSRRLRELGAYVLDADAVAREVVEPGTEGLRAVAAAFGAAALTPEGTLDRRAVAAIVFADPAQLARLNTILHPLILRRMEQLAALCPADWVVYDVPLLFESGMDADMDVVWVVDAPEALRVARVMDRDGISAQAARDRIGAQLGDAQKRARADVVIQNDSTLAALYGKVDRLWLSLNGPSSC